MSLIFYPDTEPVPVYPPASKSPLSEDHREELREAWLWSSSCEHALNTLRAGVAHQQRYQPVGIRELNALLGVPQRIVPIANLRDALMDYLRLQQESGETPLFRPEQSPETPPVPHISDAACHMTQAVCRYLRTTGDSSLLAERVNGLRVIDRVFAAMEYLWTEQQDKRSGLIKNACAGEKESAGVHMNAFASIAAKEMLDLPGGNSELRRLWTGRIVNLGIAIRSHLWDASEKRYTPRRITRDGVIALEESCIHPYATALAMRAGFLNDEEKARSLGQLLGILPRVGGQTAGFSHIPPGPDTPEDLMTKPSQAWEWSAPAALIAAAYASAGFPGHAMELLRPIAVLARNHQLIPEAFDSNGPREMKGCVTSAACYLHAFQTLLPNEGTLLRKHNKPPPPSLRTLRSTLYNMPANRVLSFKKIEFDEKRARDRVNLELPVELRVKGWLKNRIEMTCVLRNPSLTGLGLQMSKPIPEGTIIELTTFLGENSSEKECALRGRLVWSKSKVGTRLYHAGVELDSRSKHLKRWQEYIQKQIDAQKKGETG